MILGDAYKELLKMKSNSIDTMVTDPPYGLEFMSKDWDKTLPPIRIWKECFRVLKPGSFAFIMCASRSNLMARLIIDLENVGFVTEFTPIFWSYATGFPKATNVSKIVDKKLGFEREITGIDQKWGRTDSGIYHINTDPKNAEPFSLYNIPSSKQAKKLDGSYAGFQPKPAIEPIIVVMKPLTEKSYTEQAMKDGKGITWLDNARIPTDDVINSSPAHDITNKGVKVMGEKMMATSSGIKSKRHESLIYEQNKEGRFPANLIVSDDVLDDGINHKSGDGKRRPYDSSIFGSKLKADNYSIEKSEGSYSRFFDLDAWFKFRIMDKLNELPLEVQKTFPFLITPKPSVSEKNAGLESMETADPTSDKYHRPTALSHPENWKQLPSEVPHGGTNRGGNQQNSHPTVKPIKLMSWLITLGSQKGDIVLDPFLGSGTTAIACILTDRKYIGIEIDEEYFTIAMKRLEYYKKKVKKEKIVENQKTKLLKYQQKI